MIALIRRWLDRQAASARNEFEEMHLSYLADYRRGVPRAFDIERAGDRR